MKPEMPIPDINPITAASDGFHHYVGGYVISMPCILCNNKTVFVHDIYTLIDFIDNGKIVERIVKFFEAYRTGYVVTIVILDLESGELVKRKHRLNNDALPCDWILMSTDYLKSEDNKDELLEFEF